MVNQPQSQARPRIKIEFLLGGLAGKDFGHLFRKFEFRGMMNGGYIIRAGLFDTNYNLLNQLIEEGYFKETRKKPVYVKFQILASPDGVYPQTATKPAQLAILLSIDANCKSADIGNLDFIALDPPSWFLNMGDAAGTMYKGRVDQVISKVIKDYAPSIQLMDVSRTIDSEENKWWMMRQDPKTFLASLMDWSASITQKKTQWLVEMDGNKMWVREQAAIPHRHRAYYRYFGNQSIDTIQEMSFRADNALSVVETKLLTSGCAAISGQYLDRIVDQPEKIVFVKDNRTLTKQVARISDEQGFSKPPDARPQQVGWSHVTSIPEIYSAGDLGVPYEGHIDGRPRAMWLNMVNALLRAKFTVLGHGEWSETQGLGVDTMFVKWTSGHNPDGDGELFWWPTGNWVVYGFHHIVTPGGWMTDLFGARFDWDSAATKVGGGSN
jgi:hypothetical protein